MAAHLIAPITVPGHGLQCVKHGATTPPWRTLSFPEGDMALLGAENADRWLIIGDGVATVPDTRIHFATCCIWKATVRFFLEFDSAFYEGSVWLNGTRIDFFEVTGSAGEVIDITIDLLALGLIARPCGNLWEIRAAYSTGTAAELSIDILDIHFGPTP